MKKILFLFLSICTAISILQSQSRYVTEFHYDNVGTDVDEGFEMFVSAGESVSGDGVYLYRGDTGKWMVALTFGINCPLDPIDCNGTGCIIYYPYAGVRNADNGPDGFAYVQYPGQVLSFLSYEGTFTATNGPADGMTSTDIGVFEDDTTPIGHSIQLTEAGIGSPPGPSNFDECNELIILPVKLDQFKVRLSENKNPLIKWSTLQETNSDYFEILWSEDGNDFESIHNITAQGHSNSTVNYSYEHKTAGLGVNYYRLKQVDMNGDYVFSGISAIQLDRPIENLDFRPTKVANTIELFGDIKSIEISNAAGQVINSIKTDNIKSVDLSSLNSGIYFIKLNGQTDFTTKKLYKI